MHLYSMNPFLWSDFPKPPLDMTAGKKFIKTLPFGTIVQNNPADHTAAIDTPPLSTDSSINSPPRPPSRRRSPHQRKYDKLQRQLSVANVSASFLDTLAEHLGCGEGNELDFEDLSEPEVSKI